MALQVDDQNSQELDTYFNAYVYNFEHLIRTNSMIVDRSLFVKEILAAKNSWVRTFLTFLLALVFADEIKKAIPSAVIRRISEFIRYGELDRFI